MVLELAFITRHSELCSDFITDDSHKYCRVLPGNPPPVARTRYMSAISKSQDPPSPVKGNLLNVVPVAPLPTV